MSFVSVDPQSRVVLESHSHSLLAQFDTQLGIIGDRYLGFFQERRRIQAKYIQSLRKLHRRTKTADASSDPRAEPTTTRLAWDKVTDILEREANTLQTFVNILDNDVIEPLRTFKESTEETRKRIEEDLKESAAQYADHVENKISKLQEAYLKKHHPQQCCPEDARNKGFGGKVSALFRPRRDSEPSEEVSEDGCRRAVGRLNSLRLMRVECLEDGYDCLEELIFTPTVKGVLVKYMDGMVKACAMYDDLAKGTGADVEQALRGTDSSDLQASFRRALSFSIPPPTVYCNYCSDAYSELIFGISLADLTTDDDNIPKVMRMCIEEVEKRGLNTKKIYSEGCVYDAEVLELRHRFESERICSFSSTDNIHSVATLLKRYLWDLPEPLFRLSLEDYRNYKQNRARYTENDCSLFRSKICELHPAHKASLGALLQHLFHVSSHSDTNSMTVEALASQFRYAILRGGAVVQDGVHIKGLVLEDLIQNAHTLFDKRSSPSPPVPSSNVAEATSTNTYSSLSLILESPQSAQVQAMGSTIRHRPWLVDSTPTSRSTQPSFPSLPPDTAMEIRLASSPTPLLSPLLGFPSSRALTGGVETTRQGQVTSEVRDTEVETSTNGVPAVVPAVPPPRTYVAEWRSRQPQLRPLPQPEAGTMPQSPPESVSSNSSYIPPSSATSLQTKLSP